jgi:hypothetical protein
VELITERGREAAPGPSAASSENAGGRAEGGSGLQTASEIVAVVCAGVLAGGGVGMLGGVALGAINPFFLGMVGIAAGAVASVPLGRAILKRPEGGTEPPVGLVPTQNLPDVPGDAQAVAEAPAAGGERGPWWRRRLLGG